MKVIDTMQLRALIANARENDLNCKAEGLDRHLETLDPTGKHVLGGGLLHNDTQIRVRVTAKITGTMKPLEFTLDISIAMYLSISDYAEKETDNGR